MKKLIVLGLALIMSCIVLFAQTPDYFNYQAVIRDNSGELITNQSVDVRISIIDDISTGTTLYTEEHVITTNNYGVMSLKVGDGTPSAGTFENINWSVNDKFIKTEINAGSGYVDLGTTQLLSVPYAFYTELADSAKVASMAYNANALSTNGVYSTNTDTLFVVKDHDGNVVFAVFPDGAQVVVNETAKGKVGGFAISGRSPNKATDLDILRITADSTRIYVNDTVSAKGKVGGFAVSGRSPNKSISTDILYVTADSTRVYVNENTGTKGKVGGFAVSGRSPNKGLGRHMFITTADSTRVFTQDTIGGFGVIDDRDGSRSSYMQLTPLNYFIGHNSGQKIELDPLNPGMGKYNTFFGYKAGENTVSGFKNIFMGYKAGQGNVSGGWNIFIGNEAGASVTNALSNIFIGDMAGNKITDGINNIFIGKEAGYNSTTFVSQDVFIGHGAGRANIDGGGNVYLGISSGFSSTGDENTFIGKHSGFSNTGSYNVHIGSESGIYSLEGSRNVYIGYRTGRRSYGEGNVIIGYRANDTEGTSVSYSNCIAIGDSVILTADNQIRIGNSDATSFYAAGIYSATNASAANLYIASDGKIYRSTSSKRYKKEITPLEINTANIYQLKPVSYTSLSDNKRYFGLIAEDVAEVIPELAEYAKEKDVVQGSNSEKLIPDAVRYPMLSVLLLNEVQKHQEIVGKQSNEIENLKKENEELKKRLEKLEELMLK